MYEFDPDKIEQASDSLQKVELSLTRLSRSIGTELTQALEQAVFSSKSLSDVFRGLALGISKDIFSASIKPLQTAVSTGVSSLINSFVGGGVTPFAKGGVVQGATLFGAGGGLGLMGEAGAEAIMPLSRDASGRLGVRTQGGGASIVNVTIQTPNPESFKASTGQVTATLARAVAQGQRRL
jgi:phage-related minor tail protein